MPPVGNHSIFWVAQSNLRRCPWKAFFVVTSMLVCLLIIAHHGKSGQGGVIVKTVIGKEPEGTTRNILIYVGVNTAPKNFDRRASMRQCIKSQREKIYEKSVIDPNEFLDSVSDIKLDHLLSTKIGEVFLLPAINNNTLEYEFVYNAQKYRLKVILEFTTGRYLGHNVRFNRNKQGERANKNELQFMTLLGKEMEKHNDIHVLKTTDWYQNLTVKKLLMFQRGLERIKELEANEENQFFLTESHILNNDDDVCLNYFEIGLNVIRYSKNVLKTIEKSWEQFIDNPDNLKGFLNSQDRKSTDGMESVAKAIAYKYAKNVKHLKDEKFRVWREFSRDDVILQHDKTHQRSILVDNLHKLDVSVPYKDPCMKRLRSRAMCNIEKQLSLDPTDLLVNYTVEMVEDSGYSKEEFLRQLKMHFVNAILSRCVYFGSGFWSSPAYTIQWGQEAFAPYFAGNWMMNREQVEEIERAASSMLYDIYGTSGDDANVGYWIDYSRKKHPCILDLLSIEN
jgi:hypothetical protein